MEVGSWATYRCIGEKWLMKKPIQLTHVEAAAITMAACVAWGAIGFAKAKPGQKCVVVGASGAIGVMLLQFLKSLDCHVTAVCSGASESFVRAYGADDVVDYTKHEFGETLVRNGNYCDAVFDCVGGRDIETNAFKCLKKSGVFETVVGPLRYIGEEKLSWPAFLRVIGHVVWRMMITRLNGGPRYMFGEKYPRFVINDAMEHLLRHDIRMPVPKTIPFKIEAVRQAVRSLLTHREKGRTVIEFAKQA
jgi:alcohol dehydrogenase